MPLSVERGVTVLICTRNGKKNLRPTLQAIANQKVKELNWEIILADNASTDGTQEAARQIWDSFNVSVYFSVVEVQRPGKENAITEGLKVSRYRYVVFCDDDNWLNEDYVQKSFNIMSGNDRIGILGGFGIPVFEDDKPGWFSNYEACYAVGKQQEVNGEIKPSLEVPFIWGAGSVINKEAYQLLIDAGFSRIVTAERHPAFSRCEDLEMSQAIQLAGFKLWYDNGLIYRHFIAKEKLSWSYLINMVKQGAMARPYLLLYSALRVMNIDTKDNSNYKTYKKIWNKHRRQYITSMLKSTFTLKGLKYSLRVLFENHREGDHDYFLKLTRLYFLFSWITFSEKEFKKIFIQLTRLKNNISPDY